MVAKLSTIRRKIKNGEKLGFSERARAVNKGLLPSKAKKRNAKSGHLKIETYQNRSHDVRRDFSYPKNPNLPNGSWVTRVIVRKGNIVERVYTSPEGNVISLYPNPIHESLLFTSDVA